MIERNTSHPRFGEMFHVLATEKHGMLGGEEGSVDCDAYAFVVLIVVYPLIESQ